MEHGKLKVNILYASVDYDELIGKIEECSDKSPYQKGDKVCIILDYKQPSFQVLEPSTPFSTLIVSEESCIQLRVDDETLSQLLPMIKYGTISCYILQEYNITSDTHIKIDASNNIYRIMDKFLKQKTVHISQNGHNDLCISFDDNILCISTNDKKEKIDFNFESLISVFGFSNIKKIIDYIVERNMLADVIHICRGDSLSRSNKSRFFDIIDNVH
jgi:hypothetical protein